MANHMKTMQGCCCATKPDPCNLIGDPPDAMTATIIRGGTGPFVGGPHLLPNEGTLADLMAAVTGGRQLGNACYYYWSNQLGSGTQRLVLGVNAPGAVLWAINPSVGGPITATISRLWAVNPAPSILNWAYFDAPSTYVYGDAFGNIVGEATAEASP